MTIYTPNTSPTKAPTKAPAKARLTFTPHKGKNDDPRVFFLRYEEQLRLQYPTITGRVCYIVSGIYTKGGVPHKFVKIGWTDSFFSFDDPIQGKRVNGRFYTIIMDLRKIFKTEYVKIDTVLAAYKEIGSIPIKSFEAQLLKETKEWKLKIGAKMEYRDFESGAKILAKANKLQEEFSQYIAKVL